LFRFTWLDAALIGGGVIATGFIVYAVTAKVIPPKKYRCTGAPNYQCVEDPAGQYDSLAKCVAACKPVVDGINGFGIPAVIEFPVYPTSFNQLYGFYYTMADPISPQILQYKALTSFTGPPYPEGQVTKQAKIRVVDAAGRGVPNVAVLIWSVPTRDDQSGRLIINNSMRSEAEPLRLVTDANGEIILNLHYLLMDIKVLEDRHRFGCCTWTGWTRDIDVGGSCGPVPAFWICNKAKDAYTNVRAYTVNARIENTVKASLFVVACQAVGKALW